MISKIASVTLPILSLQSAWGGWHLCLVIKKGPSGGIFNALTFFQWFDTFCCRLFCGDQRQAERVAAEPGG